MDNEKSIREAVSSVNADSDNAEKTSAANLATSSCDAPLPSSSVDYALFYAKQGISVIPIKCGDKKPLIIGGYQKASLDLQQIKGWWKKWPDARIGLPTGRINGFFVLDIDKKEGKPSGYDTLRDLEAKNGELPPTCTVRTQSGGEHRYFRAPGEFPRCSVGKLGPGLDIRGEGGHVVAAGSHGYRLLHSIPKFGEFAEAPEWLLSLCSASSSGQHTASAVGLSLAECVENIENAKEGERHTTILKNAQLAGRLILAGKCTKKEAICKLKEAVDTHRYTQDERETEYKTIEDGIKYELANHRVALTDMQIVDKLKSEYGAEDLKFFEGSFKHWSGKGFWDTVPSQTIRDKIRNILGEKATAQRIKAVEELAAMSVSVEDVSTHAEEEICCENGVILWNGNRWCLSSDFRHDSFNTVRIDVKYSETALCPQFRKYLTSTFGSDEKGLQAQRAFCEMMGYTLFKTCGLQKCAFLYGRPASGKSVAMHILQALVGKDNSVELPLCDLKSDTKRAALAGKLLHTVSDLTTKSKFDEGVFNSLIAGDTLSARHLYGATFNFIAMSTTWIATNALPSVNNFKALKRRVVLIPFLRSIPPEEQDAQLVSKLKDELPGILNMALEAFAGVKRRGNHFTVVSSAEELFPDWGDSSDNVAAFVRECCDVDSLAKNPFAYIYRAYILWAKGANIRFPVPKNAFSQKLNEVVPVKHSHSGNTAMIIGLSLKPDWASGR